MRGNPPFRSRGLLNVKPVKMLGDIEAHVNPKESQIYCRGYWNLGSSAGCGARAGASGEGSSASGCPAGRTLRQWASTVGVLGHGNPHSAAACPANASAEKKFAVQLVVFLVESSAGDQNPDGKRHRDHP